MMRCPISSMLASACWWLQCLVVLLWTPHFSRGENNHLGSSALLSKIEEPIVVSIVACGGPESRYVAMLKRLLLSIAHNKERHDHYKIYVFYNPSDIPPNEPPEWLLCPFNTTQIEILLNKMHYRHRVHVKLTAIPDSSTLGKTKVGGKEVNILDLFKKCATTKLWLPDLLPSESAVINLDTDMIVLESLHSLWQELDSFGAETYMALTEEGYTDPTWYNYHKRIHPGKGGLNSGTILFDLNKARKINTTELFKAVLSEKPAPTDFSLGDQDVLNVIFARNALGYKPLPCRWNRRLEGCLITEDLALQPGILHANRDVLYNKEDWTDKVSTLHRAAFTMYSNLLIEDPGWCVPVRDATPGSRCNDVDTTGPDKKIEFIRDGSLYQGTSSKEVYLIHGGLRHLFENVDAFMRMNLEFKNVKIIPDYMLRNIPLGNSVEKFNTSYTIKK